MLLSTLTEEGLATLDTALAEVLSEGVDRDIEVDVAMPSGD